MYKHTLHETKAVAVISPNDHLEASRRSDGYHRCGTCTRAERKWAQGTQSPTPVPSVLGLYRPEKPVNRHVFGRQKETARGRDQRDFQTTGHAVERVAAQ